MSRKLTFGPTLLMLVVGLILSSPNGALAQKPLQVNPAGSVLQEQQLLKEAPLIQGRISIPDKRESVLIQPAGRDWRVWRTFTLPWLGAVAIVGITIALLVFLAVRGSVKVDAGLSGEEILRFKQVERLGHWLTATSFLILALTGLNVTYGRSLLLPLVGHDSFTWISQMSKYLHNYMGLAFVVGLVMIIVLWVAQNIPTTRDLTWLSEGGGIIGNKHPPADKFNAGQKIVFWTTVLGGLALAITGFMLMVPFGSGSALVPGVITRYTLSIDGLQTISMLHGAIAVLMIAVIIAHIYIGTIGMEGAFSSMGTGNVDRNWAEQHHSIWAREMGKATPASETPSLRPFLLACLTAFVIAGLTALALVPFQTTSEQANATVGARVDPSNHQLNK